MINGLIMQHILGKGLFTYIQEAASQMESAINHTDNLNIKVLFSSLQ